MSVGGRKKSHLNVQHCVIWSNTVYCGNVSRLGTRRKCHFQPPDWTKWFVRLFRRVLPAAPGLPRLSCWHPDETAHRGQHSKSATPAQTHVHNASTEPRGDACSSGLSPPRTFCFQIPQTASIPICCCSFLYTHTNTIIVAQKCLIKPPK